MAQTGSTQCNDVLEHSLILLGSPHVKACIQGPTVLSVQCISTDFAAITSLTFVTHTRTLSLSLSLSLALSLSGCACALVRLSLASYLNARWCSHVLIATCVSPRAAQ